MRAYIDSDVLIWHLRGRQEAAQFLRTLDSERGIDLWIGAIQRAEILFFMRPEEEKATRALLSRFRTEPVGQEGVDLAADIYRRYYPSCGMDVNDALLAATAQRTGGTIYTLNVKHFPVSGLTVVRAWQ